MLQPCFPSFWNWKVNIKTLFTKYYFKILCLTTVYCSVHIHVAEYPVRKFAAWQSENPTRIWPETDYHGNNSARQDETSVLSLCLMRERDISILSLVYRPIIWLNKRYKARLINKFVSLRRSIFHALITSKIWTRKKRGNFYLISCCIAQAKH